MIDILPIFKLIQNAGILVESLVVGKEEDRSTWRIVFAKDATKEQRTQAQKMLDTWDSTEKVVTKTQEDRISELESRVLKLEEITGTTNKEAI